MTDAAPSPTPADHAALRAGTLLELAQFEHALSTSEQALAADPQHAALLTIATHASLALDRPEQGLDLASRAVGIHPDDGDLVYLLSVAQSANQQRWHAYQTARRLAQIRPSSEWSHMLVARTAQDLGGDGTAQDAATRAIELAPDNPNTHLLMVDVLTDTRSTTSPDRLRRAEEHARAAAAIAPDHPEVLHTLAQLATKQRRDTQAAGFAASAVLSDPTNVQGHRELHISLIGQLGDGLRLVMCLWPVTFIIGLTAGDQGRRWFALFLAAVTVLLVAQRLVQLHRDVPQLGLHLRAFARRRVMAQVSGWCGFLVLIQVVVAALLPPGWWAELAWASLATLVLAIRLHHRAVARFVASDA